MNKQLKFCFVLLMLIMFFDVAQSQSNGQDITINEVVISTDDPREVRAIRAYCKEVDQFIVRNRNSKRDFIHTIDKSTSRFSEWMEVTGDKSALWKSFAGAVAYKRNGKLVFVECFGRNRPNFPTNIIRYYFRPDGTLAKLHTVVRTSQTGNINNRVVVSRGLFSNKRGVGVGQNEEFRNAKTGKKIKPVTYSAEIHIGFSLFSIRRVSDLPFFELIQKSTPNS